MEEMKLPAAVLGLKSVELKPLGFGSRGEGGTLSRAELEFTLTLYVEGEGADGGTALLSALNGLIVRAAALEVGGIRSPQITAGAANFDRETRLLKQEATLKTSALVVVEEGKEAEIIELSFSARVTI